MDGLVGPTALAVTLPSTESHTCDNCPFALTFACSQPAPTRFAHPKVLSPRTVLYHAGAPAAYVYLICKGNLKLLATDAAGGEHVLDQPGAGDHLGCEAMFASEYQATAVTVSRVELCAFRVEDVRLAVEESPALAVRLGEVVLKALWRARDRQVLLGLHRAPARVARYLTVHAEATAEGLVLKRRLSLADLGAATGMTGETVCRVLAEFEQAGLTRSDRDEIRLLLPDRLREIALVSPSVASLV